MKKEFLGLKFFILISIVSATFFSCKKDANQNTNLPGHYVKFKANGVQKEYSQFTLSFTDTLSPDYYTTNINGVVAPTTASNEGFYITIAGNSQLKTGSYTDTKILIDGDQTPQTIFQYIDNAQASYFSYLSSASNLKVQITEINNIEIKGTFSGTVQYLNGSYTIVITEGEFFVKKG